MNAPSLRHPDRLLIGGAWVEPHSGRQLEIISPDTEQVAARVAEADEIDMDRAVAAARKAFDEGPWPWLSPAERVAAMTRLVAALRRREPELAAAWSRQMGGLVKLAPRLTARGTQNLQDAVDLGGKFPAVGTSPFCLRALLIGRSSAASNAASRGGGAHHQRRTHDRSVAS